ncbi:MAG: Jag N-terminal domain-containing protein [Eubacterium sp.]|nr:Jag N-terminal domain-containing protein [Eubacterium sp.]
MIKEFIATAKTLDEARAAARAGLNAPETADVKIEIIEMPRKKILGLFGGADAKVKASYDDGVKEKKPKNQDRKLKPQKQQAQAKKKEQPKKAATKPQKAEPKKEEKPEVKKDYPKSVDLEYAKAYLMEIVKGLDIKDATVDASYSEGVITLDLSCEDYGIIIGRRGDTLDAVQYLLSLAMKKHGGTYVRVSINAGDYREKRNETLRGLARKNAAYVLRTGRRYTFEPMNPYERRVIHTTVQEIEGVESRSIGYDQERRVVIEPVGGAVKAPRRESRQGGRGGRGRGDRPKATTTAPADYVPKDDRPDLPKFGKIEVNKD